MIIDIIKPNLTPYQQAILNSTARFTVTEAATKSGKTYSHLCWIFFQAHKAEKKGANFWWVAPVYVQTEIAFKRMHRLVAHSAAYKINESELTITCPNGAIIWFRSGEKPDNLYGEDVYACVIDEFTRLREESWHAVRSTLTKTQGPCKFIGNVKGKNNWGYKLALKAKHGEPDFEYFKITAHDAVDAGILSKEEIEAAKRELPDNVFKELYLSEASDDVGNPFGYEFIEACTKPLSNKPAVCYGIDLAKSVDWTVITGLDKDRMTCYFNRFQHNWGITKEFILQLPKSIPIAIDCTGVGDPIVEELQKNFPLMQGVRFTSQSKQAMMEGLAMAIQQQAIGFPEGVITDELKQFEYEYTRTGVKYTAPSGAHDDCVCALALANKQFTKPKMDYSW